MKCRKFIISLLCVFIITVWNDVEVEASTIEKSPLATLYSASDFQNPEGHIQGAKELDKIVKQIYNSGNEEITEAFICGDYYEQDEISKEESEKGIDYIYKILNRQWGLKHDEISFVQGNHDPFNTEQLDTTGGIDREYYSIYQINHDEYMWIRQAGIDIETKISETASELRVWLNEKVKIGYSKPIFVITHLPLHHTHRYDNPYSEYLFDVLNEAGANGLNIVYLFGHNHSKEYDNYLGGSAIYLAKGEEIIIPDIQGSNTGEYKSETLNFTYMNAGYIGKSSDGILSSCIFKIYEDEIEIQRYTKEGECNLKESGVSSENDLGWSENLSVKKSPQVIKLNQGTMMWDENIDSEKVVIDVDESADLKVNVQNLKEFNIKWECANTRIADLFVDGADNQKARITGKKYGNTRITVELQDSSHQTIATLDLKVQVVPGNAVCLSMGEYVRYYGLVDDMAARLTSESLESNYIISNSNKTGSVRVLAAQTDEYVDALKLQSIYVPGIGNLIAENKDKNILWRFRTMEEISDNPRGYQIQISSRSLLRGNYYLAVTSGIDSSLGYPNLTNMRTCSKNTSSGAAVFEFVNEAENQNCLLTMNHYRDGIKENENGKFYLTYDNLNEQFVLSDQHEHSQIYYYGKIEDEVSDVMMWVDNAVGKARIGDETSKQTGGTIFVMHNETIEEIPVTLEMLSGFDENQPGKYSCILSFNGEAICDYYELDWQKEKINLFLIIKDLLAELFN